MLHVADMAKAYCGAVVAARYEAEPPGALPSGEHANTRHLGPVDPIIQVLCVMIEQTWIFGTMSVVGGGYRGA